MTSRADEDKTADYLLLKGETTLPAKRIPRENVTNSLILKAIDLSQSYGVEIVDWYFATHVSSPHQVLIVIYSGGGIQYQEGDIIWTLRGSLHLKGESKLWAEFSHQKEAVHALINAFYDSACTELLERRSDVVGIFPSAAVYDEGIRGVLCVVVKVLGYIPIGESEIEPFIIVNGSRIDIIKKTGFYIPLAIQRGSSIACLDSFVGFGTMGCIAFHRDNAQKYAVTCEHVLVNSLRRNMGLDKAFCCNPPVHRKFNLLSRLNETGLDATGQFKHQLDSLFDCVLRKHAKSQELRKYLAFSTDMTIPRTGGDITIAELDTYLKNDVTILSDEYFCVKDTTVPLNESKSVLMSSDIALVPLKDSPDKELNVSTSKFLKLKDLVQCFEENKTIQVAKIGATTEFTEGELVRLCHIQRYIQDLPEGHNEHLLQDRFALWEPLQYTAERRILYSQILLFGDRFGAKGDSGSLVTTVNNEALGIFTGKLGSDIFTCSSIEGLLSEYDIIS